MVQHVERLRPPGRNDPCPCGSGKKYKRCCLEHESSAQPERHLDDVVTDVFAADEVGDTAAAIAILEEARSVLHGVDLDSMLVERYMELPPAEAEPGLRRWWEQEHDRFSGAGLARFLVDRDRKEEALEILAESKGTDAWPEYWSLLASLRDEHGETSAAVAAMELYVRLVTENVDAWITLADMQERAGLTDRALLSLRRAGDLAPEQILPRMLRLRILSTGTRWREARDLAEALLEGHYEDSTAEILYDLRHMLAQSYWILGNVDGARRLWAELLEERPADIDARFGLATLELSTQRYRRVLLVLDGCRPDDVGLGILELRLRALLALHEYEEAERTAHIIEAADESISPLPLVRAAQATADGEHAWALTLLEEDAPEPYIDLWLNLRLDCLVRAGRWADVSPVLKGITQPDDTVFTHAALCALASGKLDLVERIVEKIDDQQCSGTRALVSLLGPLRQSRRAAEVRRQQQVDQAEKQRWAAENRELRRRVRELERHNAGLAESLARAEAALERFFETAGGITEGALPGNWEAQVQEIVERAHKDAQAQEFQGAEHRVREMVGDACWSRLSESVRSSLREGEWLFTAVEGEDRDYGAALLEYARGLESAFKEAIFARARAYWQRRPGPTDRLEDEGHDPSLGPLVRYVLHGGHLTLGSMAASLDRMADVRRQGVAVTLLRRQLNIAPQDEWSLANWKRIADRLAAAADARNQPAHAAAVSRDDARAFRDLVVGTDGLLRCLDLPGQAPL